MKTLGGQVAEFCADIARDRRLVQAAGGNVSWKEGDELWIKASGTWLANATTKDIFVPVDLVATRAAVAHDDFAYAPAALHGHTLRPSIETLLHALMPQRIVVHLHPVDAVAHLIRPEPLQALERLLGNTVGWALVPYQKPGAALARAVKQALDRTPAVSVVLLQNHGVILGGDSLEEIRALLLLVSERLRLSPSGSTGESSTLPLGAEAAPRLPGYRPCLQDDLHALAVDPALYRRLSHGWAICPDHVVFLGPQAVCIDASSVQLPASATGDGRAPFVFVRGQGVQERVDVTAAQSAQLAFYYDVMRCLPVAAPLQTLSEHQVADLLNWDAEKYRQQLNRSA